jgi:hypothetical protein
MKNFRKILNYFKPQKRRMGVLILLGFLTFWACRNDAADLSNPIDMPSGGDALVQLKYTAEIMSYTQTDLKSGKLTALEEIQAMPRFKRNEVNMIVYKDGSCQMTMRELTPKNQTIKIEDLAPPNTRPKSVFTKVERDGTTHTFDKNNKEIHKFQMNPKLDLSKWVEMIKNDSSAATKSSLVSYIFGNKMGGVRATLAEALMNGGSVTPNGDGSVLVRIGKSKSGLGTRNNDKVFSESVIDTVKNIVKASAIFDKQSNKMLGTMAFTYSNVNNSPELRSIYLESHNPNSTVDKQQKMITITELEGVDIKM